MWLQHLFSFIGKVVRVFFEGIGTTILGRVLDIAFASSLAIAVLLRTRKEHGWNAMLTHFRQEYREGIRFAWRCALIIYLPVIIWAVGKAAYQDHEYFVSREADLHKAMVSNNVTSSSIQKSLEGQVSDWRAKCAGFESANGVLSTQNRDQQNTINGCQEKALKLLAQSQIPIVRVFPVSHDARPGVPKMEYILTTTTTRTPVTARISCDFQITEVDLAPLTEHGGAAFDSSPKRISATEYEASMASPSWSQSVPLFVTVFFVPPVTSMPDCKINVQ